MAAKLSDFVLFTILLFLFGTYAYGDLPAKCNLLVRKGKTNSITNWTWKIVVDKLQKIYYINICGKVDHPRCNADAAASVCSTSTDDKIPKNMGSVGAKVLNIASETGFTLQYRGSENQCEKGSQTTWITNIFMRCGKFLGSPQFVDVSVTGNHCVANFEFVTNEACKTPSNIPEIPCSLYGKDNKLRDLTPLIKLKGGHEVSSSISNFDFHINVCRGITAEKTGDTQGCPTDSAMCRIDRKLQTTKDLGNINYASELHFSPQNDIILVYNTAQKGDGCSPVTTITFKCPKQMGDKGPLLTAAHDCAFEVLWETDFACPQSSIMSTNSCVLKNEFVTLDLRPLTRDTLSPYKIKHDDVDLQGKTTHYLFYINVCKALVYSCGEINSTVCQEDHSHTRWSLGDISTQKMQYADGQLTLTYDHGTNCHNGLNRTTVFLFKCDYHAGTGEPVFIAESYCFYFFSWTTKYACPPSRRTGTACRVESSSGVRYDLSELVRMENASNWVALDGESSNSNKLIFINVCGQLMPRKETSQCDSGSAICMIDKGKVVSLGKYTDPPTLNQDNSIKLLYTQGTECKKDVSGKSITTNSTVTFVCQPGDLESPPVLVSHTLDGCEYQFMWKSAAACSLGLNTGDDCKVEDKEAGYVFDLTPLAKQKWGKDDFYTVNSTSQYKFQLKVCGGSNNTDCIAPNVGSCQVKKINPTQNWTLGQPNKMLYYYDGMLNLTYVNGTQCRNGINRKTHITFLCDSSAVNDGIGVPEYEKENHCVYNFRWFTKYACPAKITECAVRTEAHQYDLTSLVKTTDNWNTPGGGGTFYINVCRSLNLGPSVSGCSGTAAICLKKSDGGTINLGSVADGPRFEGKNLVITYINGDKCSGNDKQRYETKIIFICNQQGSMGSPIFLAESPECEYLFSWQTPSACPLTLEHGNNCTVEDKQYGYMFDLSHLYNKDKDYNVSVSGVPGVRIILNVCNKLVKSPKGCSGSGACILNRDVKEPISMSPNNSLTYYNGQISMTYGGSPSLNFIFECNQGTTGRETGPSCEKNNELYECHWQTAFACRPMGSVQCSIRNEDGSVDDQYDYSLLSKSERNWQARIQGPNIEHVIYFINVCRTVVLQKVARRCPPTAGVCMVKDTKYYNLGTIMHGPRKENGNIYLLYENGDDCGNGKNYSTRIQMECGDHEGEPVYVTMSKQTCVYEFLWITSTACPVNTKNERVFDNCTAVNPQTNVLFNLQSLKREEKDYVIRDKNNQTLFTLNVCRKLVKPNGCGSKSGVCQHDGQRVHNAGNFNSRLYFDDGVLYLHLSGGEVCPKLKKNRETIIQFVCNSSLGSSDPGKPVYISENDCTYYIVWHTSLVCERQYECAATKQSSSGKGNTVSTIKYSLGRLMRTDANWLVTTEDGSDDSYSYYVNLCRPLVPMPGLNCPAGAWACRVKKKADQADGKRDIQSLGRAVDTPTADDTGQVRLVYKSRTDCKFSQNKMELHFTFTCVRGSLGHPVLQQVDKCVIHVSWGTSAACPEEQTAELDKCRVFDKSTREYYSLKPLANANKDVKYYQVGSENDPHYFLLSICDGLHLNHDSGNCTGAGVCLVAKKTYKSWGLYAYRAMTYFKDEGMLILKYCSAACDSKDVTISRIIFVCDRTQRDNGKPELNLFSKDNTVFAWRTSLVCPPLEEECSFSDGSNNYNLQLLTSRTRSWYYEHNKDRFWINICRGISDGPPGCPATASVCMKRSGSDKVNIIGLTSTQIMSMKGGKLQLTYSGLPPVEGCTKSSNSKVVFSFECGNHVGQPQFVREEWSSCSFILKWKSSVACQIEREKIEENNCVLKHPVTGGSIDFKRLVNNSHSTWKLPGKDENNKGVSYFINVCGNVNDDNAPEECNNEVQLCFGNTPLHVKSKTFYYEGSMFSLELATKESRTVVINFQCSVGEGVGSPKFDYVSSDKYHFFSWPTSIVCSGDLSHEVTDIPEAGHKTANSSTKKTVGIVFGVLLALLLILVFAVVFYKPSRRHSFVSCVRMNFKRHVLRKEIKFQKLDVSDDDEADHS